MQCQVVVCGPKIQNCISQGSSRAGDAVETLYSLVIAVISSRFNIASQAMYVRRNIEARSCHHSRNGKAVSITYSGSASVVVIIQHAVRMRRFILSTMACPDLPFFFFHISS